MDQDRPDSAAPGAPGTPGNDADRRLMLVLAHLLAIVATFALWAAADAWQSATGIAAASVLSVLAAIPAGVVFATLVHEWGHFAGARVSGARYTVPRKVGLYAFDYDFSANSIPQFFSMSWGGQGKTPEPPQIDWPSCVEAHHNIRTCKRGSAAAGTCSSQNKWLPHNTSKAA